ncbi:DUF3842 family protein [Thermotalea metallivorans]|uniref:DUF3842 family protein n=1 Tax=Thermotalea metallivorans TaxID=520762 RepID=A0A140L156_9FIRM|nr:DUF3842 family protein [Thermotalea metallivorans]KXG74281.1 hypothetical protein AN619_24730 [Thermotalea metallivorans]
MKIAVIDGQGGGIGKYIIERIRKIMEQDIYILALGTNALATSAMMKAGANQGATGESAICFNCMHGDLSLIIGCLSIMFPNAMLGEMTPKAAEAIGLSKAKKLLLPLTQENVVLMGSTKEPLPHLIEEMIQEMKREMEGDL